MTTHDREAVGPQGGTPARMRRPERAARLCGGGPASTPRLVSETAASPQA